MANEIKIDKRLIEKSPGSFIFEFDPILLKFVFELPTWSQTFQANSIQPGAER